MRQIVKENNQCEDVAMVWIVQFYYGEIGGIVIEGIITSVDNPVARSNKLSYFTLRSKCIQQFTHIYGVNPLRYTPLNSTGTQTHFGKALMKSLIS